MSNQILPVILAGGDADRFWPLRHKSFFPIFGRPLLYYSLENLRKSGLSETVVVCHQNSVKLLDEFRQKFPQFQIHQVIQSDPRGMAGGVISAKEFIRNRRLLLIGPTDIYEDNLIKNFLAKINPDTQALIVGYETPHYLPVGYLQIKNGRVISIVEKPGEGKEPSNLVEFVLHYFQDADLLLSYLQKSTSGQDDAYEKSLDQMMKDGVKFTLVPYQNYWGMMKYPWQVLDVTNHYLETIKGQIIAKSVIIDSRATVRGPVIIGEKAKILENAKIIGPTHIGAGTIVGNSVMIRKSHVGDNCIIGFGSEITRSYIGNNCWFHTNYIGDSVISDNTSFGAGAVTANLRLDEGEVKSKVKVSRVGTGYQKLGAITGENVKIGVNVSLMPGVKIGSNSCIGSGVVLSNDLDEGKFCVLQQKHLLTKNNLTAQTSERKDLREKLKV